MNSFVLLYYYVLVNLYYVYSLYITNTISIWEISEYVYKWWKWKDTDGLVVSIFLYFSSTLCNTDWLTDYIYPILFHSSSYIQLKWWFYSACDSYYVDEIILYSIPFARICNTIDQKEDTYILLFEFLWGELGFGLSSSIFMKHTLINWILY